MIMVNRRSLRGLGLLIALTVGRTGHAQSAVTRFTTVACPANVPTDAQCHIARDVNGAFIWAVMPQVWNTQLVVHAHGGPDLTPPDSSGPAEDVSRWNLWVRLGYALVVTSYRQSGVVVRTAAEDLAVSRALFAAQFGEPTRTMLHGQSWGAGVAARAAEWHNAPSANGRRPFDAVLLSNGVLGGATWSYDMRMDLRVVYQAVCRNHPRDDESAYPLWQGLPSGTRLTRAQLADRVDACTGIRRPAAERTAEQARNLATILGAVQIPERTLIAHLNWGTWHFQDIVLRRTGGRNPFATIGVRYPGQVEGRSLDSLVARYSADSVAVAQLASDADPTGRIDVPVLTVHGIDDPTAFVELEHQFAYTMAKAGRSDRLLQLFTQDGEHSYLHDAAYVTAMQGLSRWLETGRRPSAADIAASCASVASAKAVAADCRFLPSYRPRPLAERVPARLKPGVPR
ncbi:MAG: hypothetical protein RLZZ621_1964 [Gemmatimonadota bacterium]